MSQEPRVGERIREERLQRGMSLRGLARAVGVSPSFVSQIETGKSRPSVSTLYAITEALGISVEDVFDSPPVDDEPELATTDTAATTGTTAGTGADATATTGVVAMLAASGRLKAVASSSSQRRATRRIGPLVCQADREVLELDTGVTWERLGRVPSAAVDFLLVTYPPGGSSSSAGQLMRHTGTEYGYLIEGELTLTLGFDEYPLGPGDAVSFECSTPHRYRNDGDRPAVGVWFVSDVP